MTSISNLRIGNIKVRNSDEILLLKFRHHPSDCYESTTSRKNNDWRKVFIKKMF